MTGSSPVIIFMVVVFPQPFEPRNPKISPRPMRKLTWSTATKSPNRRVSPSASIAGVLSWDLDARPHDDLLVQSALFRRKERNEGVVKSSLLRFGEDLLRSAMRDDLAVVHGGEPIEPARLVHIRGCNNHAHLRPTRTDGINELPELPPGERIDAGGGLVENKKVGIVHQRAAQAGFLLHAAGELAAGSICKRV